MVQTGRKRLPIDRPCPTCGNSNIDNFEWTIRKNGSKSRYKHCKVCTDARDRERNAQRLYGVNRTWLYNLYLTQNKKCAICGRLVENFSRMHTDHNHTTGKVRAMLCTYCNTGLGQFQDNPQLLRKAADYLESDLDE